MPRGDPTWQLLIIIVAEQPDLREAAAAGPTGEIARVGILADAARDIIPIGLVAPTARVALFRITTTLGPALVPLRAPSLGRGAPDVGIPGLGIGILRRGCRLCRGLLLSGLCCLRRR